MFPRYKHYYRQWRSPHVHSYHPGYQRKRATANMSKHSRNKIHSMSAVTWPRFNKIDPWEDSLLGWHLNFNCNSLFPWHGPRYSVISPNPNFGFFEPLFCSSHWFRTCWPAFKVLGLHTRSTIPVVVHTHTWRHIACSLLSNLTIQFWNATSSGNKLYGLCGLRDFPGQQLTGR